MLKASDFDQVVNQWTTHQDATGEAEMNLLFKAEAAILDHTPMSPSDGRYMLDVLLSQPGPRTDDRDRTALGRLRAYLSQLDEPKQCKRRT